MLKEKAKCPLHKKPPKVLIKTPFGRQGHCLWALDQITPRTTYLNCHSVTTTCRLSFSNYLNNLGEHKYRCKNERKINFLFFAFMIENKFSYGGKTSATLLCGPSGRNPSKRGANYTFAKLANSLRFPHLQYEFVVSCTVWTDACTVQYTNT